MQKLDSLNLVSRKSMQPRQNMTLGEVGKELGLSRERVRQIERDALKKLKKLFLERGLTFEDLIPGDLYAPDDCKSLNRNEHADF